MVRICVSLLFLIVLAVPALGAGVPLVIDTDEVGYTVSFFDEYYIVNINGTLNLENPSNVDLFEVSLSLKLSTLQFELIEPEEEENLNDVLYAQGRLYVPTLMRNETRSIRYRLYGITSDKDLVDHTSILVNAIQRGDPEINMQNIGTLKKAPLEDPAFGGDANSRVISAEFYNPSDFEYFIGDVRIIKTGGMDLNQELNSWTFVKENNKLDPYEEWLVDVLDTDAYEGEIYWLAVDFSVAGIEYNETTNVTYYTERDLYNIPSNNTNATLNISDQLDFLIDRVYIRKIVSKNIVVAGDEVEVVLLVNNFAPTDFENVTVKDLIPPGFEFADTGKGKAQEDNISWKGVNLNSRETRRITYKLKYTDDESFGLDFFEPAKLYYDNKMTMSESVPFIRKYMPETRLFVQKTIKFLDDDENVQVTIQMQNVGESSVDNIVLNEYLSSDSEFKEVSKPFQGKGIWKIDKINQSDVWETTYVTDLVGVLNTFPVVYGVESKSVMRTIILSNVISTQYSDNNVHLVEIGGVVALLIIAIVFFLPKDTFKFKRKSDLRKLKDLKGNLSSLKGQTQVSKPAKASVLQPSAVQRPAAPVGDALGLNPDREQMAAEFEKRKKEIEDMKKKIKP